MSRVDTTLIKAVTARSAAQVIAEKSGISSHGKKRPIKDARPIQTKGKVARRTRNIGPTVKVKSC